MQELDASDQQRHTQSADEDVEDSRHVRQFQRARRLLLYTRVFTGQCLWVQLVDALAYRPIGRYWRSKDRKSITSLKLVVNKPLRQLTATLTLTLTLTLNPVLAKQCAFRNWK